MPKFDAAIEAYQRRRWMRPDARRYLKPLPSERPADFERRCLEAEGRTTEPPRRPVWTEADERARERLAHDLLKLRADLFDIKWEIAKRRFLATKYRADQPRVPAGSPDGGRWADGGGGLNGGTTTDISTVRRRRHGSKPDGHHYVPHAIYSKLPLREDTRKVFDEAKTGRLRAERHLRPKEHDAYSKVVEQELHEYLGSKGILPEKMTPTQAQDFVNQVLRSRDPRIRDLNSNIWRRELIYYIRRGPRRSE